MRRRRFLASGTALLPVALAGCGHPAVVLDMNDATTDDVADEVSTTVDPGSEEYRVVESAVENGSATRRGRSDFFDPDETVRFEDGFYEVSETQLGRSEVTVYEVLVDVDPESTTPDRGEIAFEDLPEEDRRHLEPLTTEGDPPEGEGFDIGFEYGTAEEVGNDSVFVPDQQYDIVSIDGDQYRIGVESHTDDEYEYRYETTEVAPSVEAYADQVRDRYLFALEGLSEAEREVVAEAIDGTYFEDDEAFQSVIDRIREHEGIDVEDFYGTWLLEYEDVEYVTYAEW